MGADAVEPLAAVSADAVHRPGLGAHHRQHAVDAGHQQAAEHAGLDSAGGDGLGRADSQLPDGVDEHDAEGQGGQGVQGVVAVQEALEEAHGGVIAHRLRGVHGAHGPQQGRDGEDAEKQQKQGIENFSHPGEDAGGPQGEVQHHQEKQRRKHAQDQLCVLLGQQGQHAHAEGHGGGAGNGEQGADGEVQQAGEKVAVLFAH